MDWDNKLHIEDMLSGAGRNVADRNSIYFFIADEISDTGFIMKTVLNLMDKGCKSFYFFGKYKEIWHKTVEDMFKQSHTDYENISSCDSIDDAAKKAAKFLNSGREVYLLCDSTRLRAITADKIREHEMHVSFHTGSLINSME